MARRDSKHSIWPALASGAAINSDVYSRPDFHGRHNSGLGISGDLSMAHLVCLYLYDGLDRVGTYRFISVFAEVCSHSFFEAA